MHLLFIAQVYIDFQIIDRAVSIYHNVLKFGDATFHSWAYIHSQLAIAHHNKRGKNGKHDFYLNIYYCIRLLFIH